MWISFRLLGDYFRHFFNAFKPGLKSKTCIPFQRYSPLYITSPGEEPGAFHFNRVWLANNLLKLTETPTNRSYGTKMPIIQLATRQSFPWNGTQIICTMQL